MNCLRPLKRWDRGFESHLRHGSVCVYSVFVLSCVQVAVLDGLITRPRSLTDRVKDQGAEKAAKVKQRAVEP
jgi:hypothetical protein